MAYDKQTWTNEPAGGTPLSAARFNHMEDGIADVDTRLAAVEQGGGGGGGLAPATCLVVSADAPSEYRTAAAAAAEHVFVCDGTNDQVEIQAAIDLAAALATRNDDSPSGAQQWGVVQLTGGRFNISGAIACRTAVRVTGAGWLTELRADGCDDAGMFVLASDDEHLVQLDSLYLYGNYSAGGSCSAIDFDMTESTNAGVGKYPSSDPDCYHKLTDLYIDGFDSTAGRHGIRLYCESTANQRGWIIDRVQIRNISGNAVHIESSSDGFISNVHVGTVTGSGFVVDSANVKMTNNKAFYCDDWALDWLSDQGVCTGFEAQDSAKGVHAAGRQSTMTGILIDDCEDEGLLVDASRQVITGLAVSRAASRYSGMTYGVRFNSGDEVVVVGSVASTDIATRISGTPGAGSYVRITGDEDVYAFGQGAVSVKPHPPVPLTDAATIATDASQGTHFRVTIAGNRTLGAPTNPVDGQVAVWEVTASGGDRTLTLASGTGGFVFGSDVDSVPTISSGTTTYVQAVYNASAARWRVIGVVGGY